MSSSYGIAPPGYRLPESTRVGRVRLQIADLQRSIDYYERVIGLRVVARTGTSATLTAHGEGLPLVELHEKRGVQPAPRRGAYGLYHFAILLPDRASLGRFAAHIASLGLRLGAADHWVSEALYLTDPDGLGIEVYADRPREQWQLRGRELAMSTDPLDLESLVASGAGVEWTGAPAGTVIGHVHLHVGDLARGEAFYHAALGLDKVVWGFPGALFLSAGGYHHHLGTNTWSPGPSAAEDQAQLLEWELLVPGASDAAAAADSLAAAGYAVAADHPAWTVRDPWGTLLRIASPAV
ncbi:MAG TPA: VOC family protein [Vicinamibacterales bacterium]|nr:VOC family protein [Vicinamibacterales bacterium]